MKDVAAAPVFRRLGIAVALCLGGAPSPTLAARASDLDALWARRDEAAALTALAARLNSELAATPEDFGLLWRASRLRLWMAEASADAGLRERLSAEGVELGRRAIKVEPRRVEGYYFAAANTGVYSEAIGTAAALRGGMGEKFQELIDGAIALDGTYDRGGPHVAKGRFFFVLPWPKRDLDRSRAELEGALEVSPDNPRALLYLGQTLLKLGENEAARQTLVRLVGLQTVADPPEGRWAKAQAKALLENIDR